MRRLVRHAMVGVGATALALTGVAVGEGSGTPEVIRAVPATQVQISAAARPSTTSTPSQAQDSTAPEREVRPRRAVDRPALADAKQVRKRSQALEQKQKIIADINNEMRLVQTASEQADRLNQQEEQRLAEEQAQTDGEPPTGEPVGDADSPREIARKLLSTTYGYPASAFTCFDNIIMRESRWIVDATNSKSGAYGIPQALPARKMASAGADWRTNPVTQITWAVDYIKKRYGSPCEAWDFKRSHGWY